MNVRNIGLRTAVLVFFGCMLWIGNTGIARSDVVFDGNKDPVELAKPLRFSPGDLERLEFEVALTEGNTDPVTLIQLNGGANLVDLLFDPQSRQFQIRSIADPDPRAVGPTVDTNATTAIELARQNGAGWRISVNDEPAETIATEELDPSLRHPLNLEIGSNGLHATVIGFTAELATDMTIVLDDTGALVDVFKPWLGTYIQDGSEIGIPQKYTEQEIGIGDNFHGLFKQERYFALIEDDGELALVFDWGGVLPLVPDPQTPRSFVPARPEHRWAGRITFVEGFDHIFRAHDVRSKEGVPFLEDGAQYVRSNVHGFDNQSKVGQGIKDIFAKMPDGFINSRRGCYDLVKMDLTSLQQGDGGCKVSLFQSPPDDSRCYATDVDKDAIGPCGWEFAPHTESFGGSLTTFIDNSTELTSAMTEGSGLNFNLLGLKVKHNTSLETKRQEMVANKTKLSAHIHLARHRALVIQPTELFLSFCFVKDILRAAPGAEPPHYFTKGYTNKNLENCDGDLDAPIAGDATDYLRQRYGTHFAYAITYGARGHQFTTYTEDSVSSLLENKKNVSDAISFDIDQKIKSAKVQAGGGADSENKQDNVDAVKSTLGRDYGTYDCVGSSSCRDGQPDLSHLVPIYLHLRPLDELLAPPYFTDPKIIIDLRQKLRANLQDYLEAPAQTPRHPSWSKYFRVEFSEPTCSNWGGWKLATELCPKGKPNDDVLGKFSVLAFAIHQDGISGDLTTTELKTDSLANVLKSGMILPAVNDPEEEYFYGFGVRVLPTGYEPTADEDHLAACDHPECGVTIKVEPSSCDEWQQDVDAQFGPNKGMPTPAAWKCTFAPEEMQVIWDADADGIAYEWQGKSQPIQFPFREGNGRLAYPVLELVRGDEPVSGLITGDKSMMLQIFVEVAPEEINLAKELGFPSSPAPADLDRILERPTALIDAATPRVIQPRTSGQGWQIGLFNRADYPSKFHVTYRQGNELVELVSAVLPPDMMDGFQLLDMPYEASDIEVRGVRMTSLSSETPIFEERVKLEDNEPTCFKTTGTTDEPKWLPQCYSDAFLCLGTCEDDAPFYARPNPWRAERFRPRPKPAAPVAHDEPSEPSSRAAEVVQTAHFSLEDAAPVNVSLPAPQPEPQPEPMGPAGVVTFFNEGGYVARYSLMFQSEGEWVRQRADRVTLGRRPSFLLPPDASNIRVEGEAMRLGNRWKRIFAQQIEHPRGNLCIKTYGTVFSPAWNHNC